MSLCTPWLTYFFWIHSSETAPWSDFHKRLLFTLLTVYSVHALLNNLIKTSQTSANMFLENHLRMHLWHPLISHINNAIYTLITFIGHPPSMCTLNPLLHRLLQTYCSISSLSTSLMSTYCANAMCLNLMSYINRLTRIELSRTLLTTCLLSNRH